MDLSEKSLETLIVDYLRDKNGYEERHSRDYDVANAIDKGMLEEFLHTTQQDKIEDCCCFATPSETTKFYARLKTEIQKRGVTDVLRKGYRYNNVIFDMYYPTPIDIAVEAKELHKKNIFEVIRQLHYSQINPDLSIDVVVLINGLPILTIELKNHYTHQTVKNAIAQYKTDRDPKDLLLNPKRCAVHLAVDDDECWMCTELKGAASRFLPFNKGCDGGCGNPLNPHGVRSAYLWEEVLRKDNLANILENYAQVVKKGKSETVVWPRYHQWDCAKKLLEATKGRDIGQRFLVMHSAGSGKSNTITWLAYQLVSLFKNGVPLLDSVIVVTDSRNLDQQIKENITAFKRMSNIIAWASTSGDLANHLAAGKKIIITILHKFPYIVDSMANELQGKQFAVIIDEAHSSQGGSMASTMSQILSNNAIDEEEDDFDTKLEKLMKGRKLPHNANYYAFTATPKNKTLSMFGTLRKDGKRYPFHEYSMKQAIQEGFILDVLRNFTVYDSYYNIVKSSLDDPEYDTKEAQKKLRAYVERQPKTIEKKSYIMVEHFCTKTCNKIGGKARAMVVTKSIMQAISYYNMIKKHLEERGSQYKAVIAFTGEKEYEGHIVTEETFNQFPSSQIPEKMKEEPYRILVVANKYQTGYDEPLMHTMYVDKQLSDVKAVQTLSRLNRCHPLKNDTFVLDFYNKHEDIIKAFQTYYQGVSLSSDPDPNLLNDLLGEIEELNFYDEGDVAEFFEKFMGDATREDIEPIINRVADNFKAMDEEKKIAGKSRIKAYVRAYPFLASVIPYCSPDWEMNYNFYVLLLPKLPKLPIDKDDDDLIENVDFDKYRIVKKEERNLVLEDKEEELSPVGVEAGAASKDEGNKQLLSTILDDFNKRFGGINWSNKDLVNAQVMDLPQRLINSQTFVNAALNNDKQTAKIQCGTELMSIIALMMQESTELPSRYFDDNDFRNFVLNYVFETAYNQIKGKQKE